MTQKIENSKTWHQRHREQSTFGQRLSDGLANGMGSWRFIVIQTVLVGFWLTANVVGIIYRWDPYPFILLNLLFSVQAAYAAPIIMMSQNRQNERDRFHSEEDYKTNIRAKEEIEELQISLFRIENEKLSEIYKLLKEIKNK